MTLSSNQKRLRLRNRLLAKGVPEKKLEHLLKPTVYVGFLRRKLLRKAAAHRSAMDRQISITRAVRKELKDAKTEAKDAKTLNFHLKDELDDAKDEIAVTKRDVKRLRRERDEAAETERARARAHYERKFDQEVEKAVRDQRRPDSGSVETIRKLRNELLDARNKYSDLEKEHGEALESVFRLDDEVFDLQNENRDLRRGVGLLAPNF